MKKGLVYLTGAGPGDPELITAKALRVLGEADCIVYDYLANESFINVLDCEKIYAGKQGGSHTMPQEEINALIIEKARAGKTVVRLKGGDPFIFGRGGEEAEELAAAGIPFEIIPGISSFYSAPAYAGIPVTHRDFANAFEVITGHRRTDNSGAEDINLPDYNGFKTCLFLMGMKNLRHISQALINKKHFPPETPAAIISWGTHPRQKTVTGTLADIASAGDMAGIKPPAVIVVGGVVSLRDKLRWFDNRPLFGKRLAVTRSRRQASMLSAKLSALGADVIEFPTIEIRPANDMSPLISAIENIASYQWLIFTSQNAAAVFFEKLFASGKDARSLAGVKLAAIGRATKDALKACGLLADLMPEEFVAEGLLASMKPVVKKGDRILLPSSSQARTVLPQGLRALGALVDVVHIYEPAAPKTPSSELLNEVSTADCVVFASSSAVRNFFKLVPEIKGVCASIGPVTSGALRELGYEPAIEAATFTIDELAEKITEYFERGN